MDNNEKCLYDLSSEYKVSFRKRLNMQIKLYLTYLFFEGVSLENGRMSDDTSVYRVPYTKLVSVVVSSFQNNACLLLSFYTKNYANKDVLKEIYILGLDDCEECKKTILHRKDLDRIYNEQQSLLKTEREKKEKQIELEAEKFFDDCYRFHVKNNTPIYTLYQEKNRIVLIYLDDERGMSFLKIDGYERNEDVGLIPYSKIHYYEKAGDIHYVSETNGSYSSFGGSLTGATFSKKAALFSGLFFGLLGMATATLMTYKPAEQKPPETHLDFKSEIKRIDERNVILNFYSDEKKQYVDIELPQDIYNFLQTYLPQKRYAIVSELEKQAAIKSMAPERTTLKATVSAPELTEPKKLSLDEFKVKVEKLKLMREADLLSDEEFNKAKAELISTI